MMPSSSSGRGCAAPAPASRPAAPRRSRTAAARIRSARGARPAPAWRPAAGSRGSSGGPTRRGVSGTTARRAAEPGCDQVLGDAFVGRGDRRSASADRRLLERATASVAHARLAGVSGAASARRMIWFDHDEPAGMATPSVTMHRVSDAPVADRRRRPTGSTGHGASPRRRRVPSAEPRARVQVVERRADVVELGRGGSTSHRCRAAPRSGRGRAWPPTRTACPAAPSRTPRPPPPARRRSGETALVPPRVTTPVTTPSGSRPGRCTCAARGWASRPSSPARPSARWRATSGSRSSDRQRVAVDDQEAWRAQERRGALGSARRPEDRRLPRIAERARPGRCPSPTLAVRVSGMWCRFRTTSVTPAARSRSRIRHTSGRPATGSAALARTSESGRRRVARPGRERRAPGIMPAWRRRTSNSMSRALERLFACGEAPRKSAAVGIEDEVGGRAAQRVGDREDAFLGAFDLDEGADRRLVQRDRRRPAPENSSRNF